MQDQSIRTCLDCGSTIRNRTAVRCKPCAARHRWAGHSSQVTCSACGNTLVRKASKAHARYFCNAKCHGAWASNRPSEAHPCWAGGKRLDKDGYVLVKKRNHPHATSDGYVREHRLVMEAKLNRLLRADEVVHHKDGNKQNNDPDNLEVLSPSEHNKITFGEGFWTDDRKERMKASMRHTFAAPKYERVCRGCQETYLARSPNSKWCDPCNPRQGILHARRVNAGGKSLGTKPLSGENQTTPLASGVS